MELGNRQTSKKAQTIDVAEKWWTNDEANDNRIDRDAKRDFIDKDAQSLTLDNDALRMSQPLGLEAKPKD